MFMPEGLKFATPAEELEYLRAKVLAAEKRLESAGAASARETVVRESIAEFKKEAGVGAPVVRVAEAEKDAETLLERHQEVELEEMMVLAEKKGIFHALSVMEKLKNWRSEDDFHAFLIDRIIQGLSVAGVKEQGPIYQALHMRLLEIVLPKEVRPGREILVSEKAPILPGNRLPLGALPPGTFIYNIALSSEGKAVLVRSAGSFAEIVAHDGGYATIKLPSGEFRKVKDDAWASIGQVSNEENNLVVIGKAGRSRLMGIRPTVRGSAMNPVDHPYGGGEGRTLRGTRRPKNKWGRGTRGVKTRNPNKYSSKFIISRRTKN